MEVEEESEVHVSGRNLNNYIHETSDRRWNLTRSILVIWDFEEHKFCVQNLEWLLHVSADPTKMRVTKLFRFFYICLFALPAFIQNHYPCRAPGNGHFKIACLYLCFTSPRRLLKEFSVSE